jgi:hypothetical protein
VLRSACHTNTSACIASLTESACHVTCKPRLIPSYDIIVYICITYMHINVWGNWHTHTHTQKRYIHTGTYVCIYACTYILPHSEAKSLWKPENFDVQHFDFPAREGERAFDGRSHTLRMCVCACIYIYMYMYVYIYIYIHAYIHVWTPPWRRCIYMYIYIYIYTYNASMEALCPMYAYTFMCTWMECATCRNKPHAYLHARIHANVRESCITHALMLL